MWQTRDVTFHWKAGSWCSHSNLAERETSRNFLFTRFMEKMLYVFSFTFFHCRSFSPCICAASISHFVTPATKFSCCYSNKRMSPLFLISHSLDLCRPFSRWASLACRLLSLFLSPSLALYSKFVDMTIDLSLILQTTRIQKQFPLSVFVFIDSLVVSGLQDARGYAISRQNNYELHLGCHTCLLSYFTLVCLWCGRTVRQAYGHVITKFSQRGRHAVLHFLTHGAPWPALRTREFHNNAWATCTDFKLL